MLNSLHDTIKLLTPYRLHRLALQWRFAMRGPLSSYRVLPDFLVIGTVRGGTSSLFRYLASHPNVCPSLRKETLYFSHLKYYRKGELWYRRHFPTAIRIRIAEKLLGSKILTFEATPNYFGDSDAARRAHELVPNAKILLLLRDPVERAFSHYQHGVRRGVETRSFEEAIDTAFRVENKEQVLKNPYENRDLFRAIDYIHTGLYSEHWLAWTRYFSSENFFVMKSEEFFKRTAEVFQEALSFLRLPPVQKKSFRNYSYWAARTPVSKPDEQMEESAREKLRKFYQPYNQHLYELLGRDFGWQ